MGEATEDNIFFLETLKISLPKLAIGLQLVVESRADGRFRSEPCLRSSMMPWVSCLGVLFGRRVWMSRSMLKTRVFGTKLD